MPSFLPYCPLSCDGHPSPVIGIGVFRSILKFFRDVLRQIPDMPERPLRGASVRFSSCISPHRDWDTVFRGL